MYSINDSRDILHAMWKHGRHCIPRYNRMTKNVFLVEPGIVLKISTAPIITSQPSFY